MTWRTDHDQPDGPAEAAPDPKVKALVEAARRMLAWWETDDMDLTVEGTTKDLAAALAAMEE